MIIAVAGLAGTGKDTFAEGLVNTGKIRRIALADNLKTMCQLIFGVSPWHTDTQEGKAAKLSEPILIDESKIWKITNYMSITHPEEINNVSDDKFDHLFKSLPVSIATTRQLLQFVGTEICRELVTTYHVDVLLRKIKMTTETDGWVITDCRFSDERRRFKDEVGAKLVLIRRPGFESSGSTHVSENSLGNEADYDLVVINDKSIRDLHDRAVYLYNVLSNEGVTYAFCPQ